MTTSTSPSGSVDDEVCFMTRDRHLDRLTHEGIDAPPLSAARDAEIAHQRLNQRHVDGLEREVPPVHIEATGEQQHASHAHAALDQDRHPALRLQERAHLIGPF